MLPFFEHIGLEFSEMESTFNFVVQYFGLQISDVEFAGTKTKGVRFAD